MATEPTGPGSGRGPSEEANMKVGDIVRTNVGATGCYIGHGLALYVGAQDNDLGLAGIDLAREPWKGSPLPTVDEVRAAEVAYAAGLNDGRTGG